MWHWRCIKRSLPARSPYLCTLNVPSFTPGRHKFSRRILSPGFVFSLIDPIFRSCFTYKSKRLLLQSVILFFVGFFLYLNPMMVVGSIWIRSQCSVAQDCSGSSHFLGQRWWVVQRRVCHHQRNKFSTEDVNIHREDRKRQFIVFIEPKWNR